MRMVIKLVGLIALSYASVRDRLGKNQKKLLSTSIAPLLIRHTLGLNVTLTSSALSATK
jgi:hypothetical protein